MLYRHKLDLDLNEVCCELQALRVVAGDLRSSLKFKKILQVHVLSSVWVTCVDISQAVLSVGNALNGSSFRGNARGFQLEALTKVGLCCSFHSVQA